MIKQICEPGHCTGCMACMNRCARGAVTIDATLRSVSAVIDEKKCVSCGACRNVCPENTPVQATEPIEWRQGWAKDQVLRGTSASGGIAAAITRAFIESGGAVASCVYDGNAFTFRMADNLEQAKAFAGSKYVKSAPGAIYREIAQRLAGGRKVLFIALPCQTAGLINSIPAELRRLLYTADLICHGTPSAELLKRYLNEHGKQLEGNSSFRFRDGITMRLSLNENTVFSMPGVDDRYMLSFIRGLTYTDNCYGCRYAQGKRISDITLGDNWGTELKEECRSGVSLIALQSEKGRELLSLAETVLFDVDVEKAKRHNGNLVHPSRAPECRNDFFSGLQRGRTFDSLVMRYYPARCLWKLFKGDVNTLRLFLRRIKHKSNG